MPRTYDRAYDWKAGAEAIGNVVKELYLQSMKIGGCLAWENIGNVLGAGKEGEAQELGRVFDR